MTDSNIDHELGNLRAQRDAAFRQLEQALLIVRSLIADDSGASERAERWCDKIERIVYSRAM